VYGAAPVNATLSVALDPGHIVVVPLNVAVGIGSTVYVAVADVVQPVPKLTVYVIVCVPTVGSNFPALTPVPLYTPPVGEPPVSVCNPALLHTALGVEKVTVGAVDTVTTAVPLTVPVQLPLLTLTSE
jgi:hypothetical protein